MNKEIDEYEAFFSANPDGSQSPAQGTSHEKLEHLAVVDPSELTSMA